MMDAHLGVGRGLEIGRDAEPFSQDAHGRSPILLQDDGPSLGGGDGLAELLMLCLLPRMPMQSCCAMRLTHM